MNNYKYITFSRMHGFLVFLIITTLMLVLLANSAFAKDTSSKKRSAKPVLTKVTVKPLSSLLVAAKNSVPANVVSLNHAVLGAQISGKVIKVKVQAGDIVKKNTTLLEIDCRDYVLTKKQTQAALEAATAQQGLAEKQYRRNLQLRKIKSIPQNLLDEAILQRQVASADIAVKKAALAQSRLAIERCRIKAPYAGQITEKLVSVGQLLAPNSPVFKLLQTGALEVKADLTQLEVASAKKASTLYFTRGVLKIPVSFRSVINEIKEGSRTLQARLTSAEANSDFIAGLSGRLEWQDKSFMLPSDYILRRDGRLGVMVFAKKDNTAIASFHALPDASEGQAAFIDLPTSTQIITSNLFQLKPDEAVELE